MRVKIEYVTVTKVFMYEPWPLDLDYWFNGTRLGAAYSAAFNASRLVAPGAAFTNWYQMANCKDVYGSFARHPVTGGQFICGFEITDRDGYKAVVDQCNGASSGGLLPLFMGTDYPGAAPLKVGDTLTSVTGAVKRMRGSYGRKGQARGGRGLSPCFFFFFSRPSPCSACFE